MKNIFKELFQSNRISQTEQYGVVIITENPEKDSVLYQEELRAMMRYHHVVKYHEISAEEIRNIAPHLPLDKLPAFALIREGIYRSESLKSRLEDTIVCSAKTGEIIVMIELLGQQK
ncbi:hypothetical protein [Bacillus benzoevorans]|uniref:Putative transcriptional regulator n=1 Tax=Bacillus benzoevorans TaxID=1456 RepID=A0A7X0HTP3_9BACI|nr:hypothetical protein [Bacillus benzoevorans]MBB6445520.1 putative transcriptional regulator [Bacillus benzoevorans]